MRVKYKMAPAAWKKMEKSSNQNVKIYEYHESPALGIKYNRIIYT
jgi:hypothetical protein